jgi:hypothetical protein
MAPGSRIVLCVLVMAGMTANNLGRSPTPEPEGRVTSIFHDVQLLPAQADPRAAAINDKVDEGNALRTGNDSRSELTFADLTITRLGENTIFSVNKAGRSVPVRQRLDPSLRAKEFRCGRDYDQSGVGGDHGHDRHLRIETGELRSIDNPGRRCAFLVERLSGSSDRRSRGATAQC